jgi:hypothetical protein
MIDTYNKPLKDILQTIGFTQKHIDLYLDITKDLECYSNQQLIDIIIEYSLERYNPIAPPTQHFLFTEEAPDMFVQRVVEGKNTKIMNCSAAKMPDLQETLSVLGHNLLYHATNWKGALNIIKNGPLTTIGRKCLDFGMTPSFYMSLDAPAAISWTDKRSMMWYNELAVVVFKSIKLSKEKRFDLPDQEWKNLTGMSRRCSFNELDNMKYIHGPMVMNVKNLGLGRAPKPHNPPVYQVAVKGSAATKALSKNIVCVVFIEKA